MTGRIRALLPGLAALLVLSLPVSAAAQAPPAQQVRRVFDQRCVACHACYNAPCQLDLSSFEGLARGATGQRVYQSTRIEPAPPTRLGVDAHGEAAWRERGFFPVLDPLDGDTPAYSVLGRMLAMKRAFPARRVDGDHDWMCPSGVAGIALYSSLGHDGMPRGFPALDDDAYAALMRWLDAGAELPPDPQPTIGDDTRWQLEAWEGLLNGSSARHRLVARYLYEHLFLAHLYVESAPGVFFRLVRSATPAPAPVEQIATVRPYDDPGSGPLHYRFVPITGTLVHKTHITFPLSPQRLARYRDWFLGQPWPDGTPSLPGYDAATSANPFRTFAAIPPAARYRFFLDNARYFVMSFIRGPVCEGQMAVNVINDHFHVLFLDPAHDLSLADPAFLREAGELLTLPAAGGEDPFETYYFTYKKRQQEYTKYRERRYARAYPAGAGMEAIWDGGGRDPDAALTVFRHFDNAAVLHGLRGGESKTLWVMDYPIFERIYYLLVAGFNVYGNAFHQASTRLYMDNLRVESEDLFLSFLPPAERVVLRENWYRGMLAELKMQALNPLRGADRATGVAFGEGDPKRQFLAQVKARLGAALQPAAPRMNTAGSERAGAAQATPQLAVESLLDRLTGRPAPFVRALPDLAYLLVDFGDTSGLYALVRNKAHSNVAFAFDESDRRLPEEDTLSVLRGVAGSYPNFLFGVTADEVADFVALLEGWQDGTAQREALHTRFGVSRYRADFWRHFDRLHEAVMRAEGLDGARLDLSKYLFE